MEWADAGVLKAKEERELADCLFGGGHALLCDLQNPVNTIAALLWTTADLMAERGAFLVPTLVTYQQLAANGEAAGMAPELVAKVRCAVLCCAVPRHGAAVMS